MGVYFDNDQGILGSKSKVVSNETMQPLMRMVYMWMTAGLALTGVIAAVISNLIYTKVTAGDVGFFSNLAALMFPLVILELVVVLALSWGISRMSAPVATGTFFLYAALNGLTIGIIVFAYTVDVGTRGQITQDYMPVAKAFFSTAGLFGAMSVIGYTTKVDLTRFSTFFMMAIIGLLIAVVVNIFLRSDMLSFAISVFGVLLFTGLTAYDTQRIKNMSNDPSMQAVTDDMRKWAIMGALTLYLDFINLFLYLLRLFGRRR
jgi:FtsH-binding integral membrane protein